MKISQCEFSGESDILAMISLAKAFPRDNLHIVDLPYRLSSWALDDPANIAVWIDDEGMLRSWAVMQTPFWTIDYVCLPEIEADFHQQILAWAENRACQLLGKPFGHPCWFVMVFANHKFRIHELELAGFKSQANVGADSWAKILLQRPTHLHVAEPALPEGFHIRPLYGEAEVDDYVNLHRSVFQSKNMTVEWRLRILHRPEYQPDLDLVAVAPDGNLAAFCICWLSDSPPLSGQIEPLGVNKDYRNLGLGRAILSEGLQRLSHYGVESVYVETDRYPSAAMGLYQAVGFHEIQEVLVYRKDFGVFSGNTSHEQDGMAVKENEQ